MDKEDLRRIGTLGGKLKINHENMWLYGKTSGLTKERLYGVQGPLHPGMRSKVTALEATQSDTRQTLIRELTDQTHMTRTEAERVVDDLLKAGVLEEINDPTLGKVLVLKRR